MPNPNAALSVTALTDVSIPKPRSKRTPINPFISAPNPTTGAAIVWRGIPISPDEYVAIQSAAAQQAECGVPAHLSPMFKDLIEKLVGDPTYDPASEPDPLPEPSVPTYGRGGGRGSRGGRGSCGGRGSRGGRGGRGGRAATVVTTDNLMAPADTPQISENVKAQPRSKPKVKPAPKLDDNDNSLRNTDLGNKDVTGHTQTNIEMGEESSPTTSKRNKAKKGARTTSATAKCKVCSKQWSLEYY